MLAASDIKNALKDAGFEVYRTRGGVVHIADRVRENLIMDSGVRIDGDRPAVAFYVKAQRRDFPGEDDQELFRRARLLGEQAVARGYSETRASVTEITDPGDPSRTLDQWYEVRFEKIVASVEHAIEEMRFACALEKTATR